MAGGSFIPALKYHFLTPFYDRFIRWTMPEMRVKRRLVEQAGLRFSRDLSGAETTGRATRSGLGRSTTLRYEVAFFDASIGGQFLYDRRQRSGKTARLNAGGRILYRRNHGPPINTLRNLVVFQGNEIGINIGIADRMKSSSGMPVGCETPEVGRPSSLPMEASSPKFFLGANITINQLRHFILDHKVTEDDTIIMFYRDFVKLAAS